jgi:hypothetical protein
MSSGSKERWPLCQVEKGLWLIGWACCSLPSSCLLPPRLLFCAHKSLASLNQVESGISYPPSTELISSLVAKEDLALHCRWVTKMVRTEIWIALGYSHWGFCYSFYYSHIFCREMVLWSLRYKQSYNSYHSLSSCLVTGGLFAFFIQPHALIIRKRSGMFLPTFYKEGAWSKEQVNTS